MWEIFKLVAISSRGELDSRCSRYFSNRRYQIMKLKCHEIKVNRVPIADFFALNDLMFNE